MSKTTILSPGSILSETSFYTVKHVPSTSNQPYILNDALGNELKLGKKYVDQILISADYVEKEEKLPKTQLADLFINSPRMAISVAFLKQDKPKTKKAFNAEKQAKIDAITNATVAEVPSLLSDLIDNPVLDYVPGELRLMKGYHEGHVDDLGRVNFVDMELDPKTDRSKGLRQVDPRSIQYLVIKGIKYSLKK